MQCLSFGVWLMPLKWMISSYIHLPVNNRISSLSLSKTHCTVLFMFKLSIYQDMVICPNPSLGKVWGTMT